MYKRTLLGPLQIILTLVLAQSAPARAQQPVDSSAQASPTTPAPKSALSPAPVDDAASEASPINESRNRNASFAIYTAFTVRLSEPIDSGHIKNGQTISATLSIPVRLTSGASLPAGTMAKLTVIATVPAGKLSAFGEMSLQLVRVGKISVSTDTLTYRGKAGHKDLPDSAPETGTDAGLATGTALTFHVQPQPSMASGPPRGTHQGMVNGVSSGEAPPKPASPVSPPQ